MAGLPGTAEKRLSGHWSAAVAGGVHGLGRAHRVMRADLRRQHEAAQDCVPSAQDTTVPALAKFVCRAARQGVRITRQVRRAALAASPCGTRIDMEQSSIASMESTPWQWV
jgi:hypothetical protein